ncbi:hypothetical protein IB254_12295 [Pseudomonas sp. PDM03]|uniref:hypothetical protein n=1 Tax=Pseudomonas sp. PDM03 TaxID=2769266 RepID=UPI001784B203|nr:hypothetical protein [Pseudomonas sp. PDM03]MBD9587838.1 hypothetical protein [Pseudomonas sp. PDM03]
MNNEERVFPSPPLPPQITSPISAVDNTFVFKIQAITARREVGSNWNLQIREFLTGRIISEILKPAPSVTFEHSVPLGTILPGTSFEIAIQCVERGYLTPWGYKLVGRMGLGIPYMLSASGDIHTNKPLLKLSGSPKATIRLYKAGSGAIVHGEGEAGADGTVWIQVEVPLSSGHFPMTANQTFNGETSGWMGTREFNVP